MLAESRVGSVDAFGTFDNRFALCEKASDGECHGDAVVAVAAEPGAF